MKGVLSLVKRAGSLIAGIVGGGGSLLAGFDPTTALLMALSAAMLVIGIEFAVVKEFKDLFDDDK